MKILFASSNKNKIAEIKSLLPKKYTLVSLEDIGFRGEIPENSDTIEGNAIQKATFLNATLNLPCFADDTGLIIPSLNDEPGVFSARYAGEQRNSDDNMNKVIVNLENKEDKSAYFKTVIALVINKEIHLFDGKIEGEIISEKRGENGFGYDPIFVPTGESKTFAEMESSTKNKLSHRAKAVEKMIHFLKNK